jgi:hypothetical protein
MFHHKKATEEKKQGWCIYKLSQEKKNYTKEAANLGS